MKVKQRKKKSHLIAPALCALGVLAASGAQADGLPELGGAGSKFHVGGYLRAGASINLQDAPETPDNDRHKLSMLRGTVLIDADADFGAAKVKAIARADREMKTDYLEDLENRVKATTPGGPGSNLMDLYNQTELREFHVEFDPTPRLKVRLGKQQVVWGETDFFRALDVVHGFDYRWRAFLEPENEELRKPLIMANVMLQVPEADGSMQLLFRPGWDRDRDIGNTIDLAGGRWRPQPYRGIDTLSATNFDYRHPEGEADDQTWGARWSGKAGPVNYSLAYLESFNGDPVLNSAFAPYKKTPTGMLGDWIHPKVQVYGATLSGYVQGIDAVFSGEFALTKDAAFNVGSMSFMPGVLPEGLGGIVRKDTFMTMLRMDKNLDLRDWIGTSKLSMFSVQLFNTHINGFDAAEDIVLNVGYNTKRKKDAAIITGILGMSYSGDRINPQIAMGHDMSYGGYFLIPSVDFVMGDHWRLKIEADLFYGGHPRSPTTAFADTGTMGYFDNNNQLYVRLTRQF